MRDRDRNLGRELNPVQAPGTLHHADTVDEALDLVRVRLRGRNRDRGRGRGSVRLGLGLGLGLDLGLGTR